MSLLSMPLLTIPELPDKFSELIRLALADLQKAVDEGCVIAMYSSWHSPLPQSKVCAVCLAGAVMRRAVPDDEKAEPKDFTEDTNRKLRALNYLRAGEFSLAFDAMHLRGYSDTSRTEVSELLKKFRYRTAGDQLFPVPYHKDDPRAFFKDMNQIADELAAIGY